MNEQLIKAVWAAGFRSGKEHGMDESTAWEWGHPIPSVSAEKAWEDNIGWRLEPDCLKANSMDLKNIKEWEDIP